MAVKIKELYDSLNNFEINLVAGKNGLSRVATWVHMVERADISEFLEGNEITFTTGLGLKSKEELFDLVKLNYKNKASAMVINIGPYIEEITDEIKDFCNEHAFPLFEVPWHVNMANIMRVLCSKIMDSEKGNMELISAIKNAIFFPNMEKLYMAQMASKDYGVNWSYSIAIISFIGDKKEIVNKKRVLLSQIDNTCSFYYDKIVVFEIDEKLVLLFAQYTEIKVKYIINQLIKRHMSNIEDINWVIGIGQATKNIKCIYKSYNQAIGVVRLLSNRKSYNEVSAYRDLGLYKLLLSMNNKEIIKEYYSETLEKLDEYDRINKTDFSKVLKIYLDNNGSVKETSEVLFVHRNTINYKINKIETILDCDLSNLNTRLMYDIAYMLKETM